MNYTDREAEKSAPMRIRRNLKKNMALKIFRRNPVQANQETMAWIFWLQIIKYTPKPTFQILNKIRKTKWKSLHSCLKWVPNLSLEILKILGYRCTNRSKVKVIFRAMNLPIQGNQRNVSILSTANSKSVFKISVENAHRARGKVGPASSPWKWIRSILSIMTRFYLNKYITLQTNNYSPKSAQIPLTDH